MAINTSIDHEGRSSDTVILTGRGKASDEQWYFESPGHLVDIYIGDAELPKPREEAFDGTINDICVPLGTYDRYSERGSSSR